MLNMTWWMVVIAVFFFIYFAIAAAFAIKTRSVKIGLAWPLWLLLGLFGNIQ